MQSILSVREKYAKIYERFINTLRIYAKVLRVLSKGYLPMSLLPPSKLNDILDEVKKALQVTNPDYGMIISQLYLY